MPCARHGVDASFGKLLASGGSPREQFGICAMDPGEALSKKAGAGAGYSRNYDMTPRNSVTAG